MTLSRPCSRSATPDGNGMEIIQNG